MNITEKKKSHDFNIYYLNFSKVYEIAMMINNVNKNYHFVDTLAIIQDVAFKLEEVPAPKLHWWNKFGIWLSTLWRK